jgi:hypothetical protein
MGKMKKIFGLRQHLLFYKFSNVVFKSELKSSITVLGKIRDTEILGALFLNVCLSDIVSLFPKQLNVRKKIANVIVSNVILPL